MHEQVIYKFQLKLSRLCSGQSQICFFGTKGQSIVRSDQNLNSPVQIICKSHKDPINAPDKVTYGVFLVLKG